MNFAPSEGIAVVSCVVSARFSDVRILSASSGYLFQISFSKSAQSRAV